MAELRIHQSNRLERLADLLAELCRRPVGRPFAPERIVVPNPGMARWLGLRLADRLGVCANVQFPLPSSFAWEIWRAVLEDVPEEPAFAAPVLAWRIHSLFESIGDDPAFRPLAAYLEDSDDLRRFELAEHIAEIFDQYLVYRPEMIVAWEDQTVYHPPETRDEKWQSELWRRLVEGRKPKHRARLALDLERVSTARLAAARLPPRVMVFGIPALTRMHLTTLRRLSEVSDVELFVVNPCREYWEEILPPSDIARIAGECDPADLFLESGNPLLASMGRQGRDFISMLSLGEAQGTQSFDDPLDTPTPRLLDVLQGDILDLRTRSTDADPNTSNSSIVEIEPSDRSVQLHACHSPMREVEVLHDQLLDLFRTRPELEPSQVRVMTPDIETYAPLIDSVFGTASGQRYIPYAIADRQPRAERSTIAAFLALLELPDGRFDAASVLALLETEAVRRRFELEEGDLPRLAQWIRSSGIRWGIDAEHRGALELPETPENTWRFGLDRLMLGHAMSGNDRRMFAGILPSDDVEGTDVRLMGQLDRFAEEIFRSARELAAPRTAEAWAGFLNDLLSRFFVTAAAEEDLETIREAIRDWADESRKGGCTNPLSRRLVHHGLDRLLRQPGGAWAFLSGSVTFCTMVPMRNIPAEVVCLLGMNDGSYPRSRRPPGFDLVPRHPQKGDRSRRDDDRYLFLEALLSARGTFYVSYVGRSIRDNTDIPPSILVSELLDVIDASARPRRETTPRDADPLAVETTVHPLQPFSPSYFSGHPKLFSYAGALCDAAEAARAATRQRPTTMPAFLPGPIPPPDDEWRTVPLEALLRFYRDPTKYFLKNRLGVLLDETQALIEGTEPFQLDRLSEFKIRNRLMELALLPTGDRPDDHVLLRASGELPHGLAGDRVLDALKLQVTRVSRDLTPLRSGTVLPPQTIDKEIGGIRLVGSLSRLTPEGILEPGFDEPNGRDQLALWIRHLTLNVEAPRGVALRSRRVSDRGIFGFGPVPDAADTLEALLRLYWRGLSEPLRLFPDLSLACARGKRESVLLDEVASPWNSYPNVAFRSLDPGGAEFSELAHSVFGPLIDAAESEK